MNKGETDVLFRLSIPELMTFDIDPDLLSEVIEQLRNNYFNVKKKSITKKISGTYGSSNYLVNYLEISW